MTTPHTVAPPSSRQLLLRAIARAVFYLVVLYVAANLTACILRAVIHPKLSLHQRVAETRMWEKKVAEKRKLKQQLEAKKRYLSSPLGEEELARTRANLVRPGEQMVVVTPPDQPAPKEQPAHTQQAALTDINPSLRTTLLLAITCSAIYGVLLLRRRRLIQVRQQAGVLTPRKELVRRKRTPTASDER